MARKRHRVLDGRYEIGDLLGRGGMADVYLSRDGRTGRSVAIKVLRQDLARDPRVSAGFRRGEQTAAGLSHRAIASVYDAGVDEAEGTTEGVRTPFVVMEYVAGRTLQDLLDADELTFGKAIHCQLEVLSALAHSHRAGIVHCDIKPRNVMVTPAGVVKVIDFGIARSTAATSVTTTQPHQVLGTAQYLSPEQARGEDVDARSDLYSAGCLLYTLVTGRPPFIGDSPFSVAYRHVHEVPAPASRYNADLLPAIDAVLVKALAKARQDRFQTAPAFAEALRSATEDLPADPVRAASAL